MGKRELIAFLNLSSWCLVMVERLFLAVPLGCLQFVIVVFPDHTHLLFLLVFFHFGFKFRPVSFTKKQNIAWFLFMLGRLLTFCLLLLPLWESVMFYVLLYVTLCPF